ncbi:glycosyltransferase family 2 protein [bacterium]|nr:glycosyltransferase family 2 protein [bacterium]
MKVAAVVPAYNEKDRISVVLEAIKSAQSVDEILVVSDGSTDGTYELVSSDPCVRVMHLDANRGKGGAMRAGALGTDADVILFLDADLVGMDGEKVDAIIQPVADGQTDMAIGIFSGGRGATDLAQFLTPYISGQRAMRRDVFLDIPGLDGVRSGVETAITKYFHSRNLKVSRVSLTGCTHHMKEEKLGFIRGFSARMKMYYDIAKILLDGHEFRK